MLVLDQWAVPSLIIWRFWPAKKAPKGRLMASFEGNLVLQLSVSSNKGFGLVPVRPKNTRTLF